MIERGLDPGGAVVGTGGDESATRATPLQNDTALFFARHSRTLFERQEIDYKIDSDGRNI